MKEVHQLSHHREIMQILIMRGSVVESSWRDSRDTYNEEAHLLSHPGDVWVVEVLHMKEAHQWSHLWEIPMKILINKRLI